jgi:CheY-like chemotaxis protein
VEDNRDAADSLAELLQIFGYDVQVAYTGPEGITAAQLFHPEVVLCDIGLPGVDGYEVARRLRSDDQTATVRLIAITGYGAEADRERAQAAGFDRHLVKPVDPDRLLTELTPLL